MREELLGLISSAFEMLESIYKKTFSGKTPQEVHFLVYAANNNNKKKITAMNQWRLMKVSGSVNMQAQKRHVQCVSYSSECFSVGKAFVKT